MLFWIAILTGALFTWLAVRMGFYEMWALLFNLIVSIYLSIFLAPLVADSIPMPGRASWCLALSMIALAGGCFALLHGLSWVFLTGQFKVRFPSLFDVVFSGVLGFVTGFLILSFAALTLSTTPLVQRKIVSTLGLGRQGQRANVAGIAYCCDLVHRVAGFGDASTTQGAIARLFDTSDRLSESDKVSPDPNEPNAANAPQPQPPETKEAKPPMRLHRRTLPADALN
jgi:hypothetical protein